MSTLGEWDLNMNQKDRFYVLETLDGFYVIDRQRRKEKAAQGVEIKTATGWVSYCETLEKATLEAKLRNTGWQAGDPMPANWMGGDPLARRKPTGGGMKI